MSLLPCHHQQPGKSLLGNLTTLHKATEAYVAHESSEKIYRALNNIIRTSGNITYITRDSVYFKCVGEQWRGPGKKLEQHGQQVLVKYESSYARVHPCRLALECNHDKTDNMISPTLNQNGRIHE